MDGYERIGAGYARHRRADPRLARAIAGALDGSGNVLNVGAGAGSYEPTGLTTVAVEPAATMIAQRPPRSAPCLRARVEALPFGDQTFDAGLAVLTIHHWSDWRAGLGELARVVREKVVLFTWDPDSEGFWLRDYLPDMLAADRRRFPTLDDLRAALGDVRLQRVPIPHDCTDGFLHAYWRRPEAYLDARVRSGSSSFWAIGNLKEGLGRLASDLESGEWHRRHADLLARDECDLGYRLVTTI